MVHKYSLEDVFPQHDLKKVLPAVYCGEDALLVHHEAGIQNCYSPIDGSLLCRYSQAGREDMVKVFIESESSFLIWRNWTAPARGAVVRLMGELAREKKSQLAYLITLETGKPWQESLGEVQELIDVCEFAVGLSRQLYGLTITSERPQHRMMEQWHPLGPVLVITAFNFPMAVWAWNAALALICGDTLVWKPSEQCPLCALACHSLLQQALVSQGAPAAVSILIFADRKLSEALVESSVFPLVSATGSCGMGRAVGQKVAARLGRSLLELGGNNALILTESADMALAVRAIVFAALGTCGQRCTSLRRLIVHQSIKQVIIQKLLKVYASVSIGNPLDEDHLMGPLVSESAFESMQKALKEAVVQGGRILCGGQRLSGPGCYVTPALVEISDQADIVKQETFAPILYIHEYEELQQAINMHNSVDQGLSSAIFTRDMQEAEIFVGPEGSDCGIANVNIGTSGAEIGGAFGGEKDTGGGRESGSDAWKNYMRRTTNTINYGNDLPLAQGINFDL